MDTDLIVLSDLAVSIILCSSSGLGSSIFALFSRDSNISSESTKFLICSELL